MIYTSSPARIVRFYGLVVEVKYLAKWPTPFNHTTDGALLWLRLHQTYGMLMVFACGVGVWMLTTP